MKLLYPPPPKLVEFLYSVANNVPAVEVVPNLIAGVTIAKTLLDADAGVIDAVSGVDVYEDDVVVDIVFVV